MEEFATISDYHWLIFSWLWFVRGQHFPHHHILHRGYKCDELFYGSCFMIKNILLLISTCPSELYQIPRYQKLEVFYGVLFMTAALTRVEVIMLRLRLNVFSVNFISKFLLLEVLL